MRTPGLGIISLLFFRYIYIKKKFAHVIVIDSIMQEYKKVKEKKEKKLDINTEGYMAIDICPVWSKCCIHIVYSFHLSNL